MNESCLHCRFWRPATPDDVTRDGLQANQGFCRRLPPTVMVLVHPKTPKSPCTIQTRFPTTSEHGWCGEFQQRLSS